MSEPVVTPTSSARPTGKAAVQTLAVGFGAGLVNGLVGIGGGILIVPGLILIRKLPPKVAVSTSLASVLILSSLALGFHLWWSGLHMDPTGIVLLLAACMVSAQLGTWLLNYVSIRWLMLAFACITLITSTNLLIVGLELMPPLTNGSTAPPLWGYPIVGAISGFFSGLLGVGGGGLVALGFSVAFHTPILGGLPVALAVNIANGSASVAASWRSGRIQWNEVGYLIPTAVVGIIVGTALAVSLAPNTLRVVFAIFFFYMSFALIRRAFRMPTADSVEKSNAPQK